MSDENINPVKSDEAGVEQFNGVNPVKLPQSGVSEAEFNRVKQEENLVKENKDQIQEAPKEEHKRKGLFGKTCKECEKHKAESEEYKAGWQRALADYKNLQNEINVRRGEWAQMSETQILEEFIPVYENFKKAFNHHPEVTPDNEEHKTFKNWIDGIGFIMKQFNDILKAHGVEEIKTVGEKFDPKFHEAMSALAPESDDSVQGKNQESGIIVKELEGGYKVGNKVIKAAKVIVSK